MKSVTLPRWFVFLVFGVCVFLFFLNLAQYFGLKRDVSLQSSARISPAQSCLNLENLQAAALPIGTDLALKIRSFEKNLRRLEELALKIENQTSTQTKDAFSEIHPVDKEILAQPLGGDKDFREPSVKIRQDSFNQSLNERLAKLEEEAFLLEGRLNEVYERGQDQLSYVFSAPSIWPVQGWISSDFGDRFSPFSGELAFHEGIDIAAPMGAPIFAPSDGRVSFVGNRGGYGYALIIEHANHISTLYAHTSDIVVSEGEIVRRGQTIGYVGSTGASTGPHLHYEVHVDGIPADPVQFLFR